MHYIYFVGNLLQKDEPQGRDQLPCQGRVLEKGRTRGRAQKA